MTSKTLLFIFLSLTTVANAVAAKEKNVLAGQAPALCFIENKGQFADQNFKRRPDVLFGGSDGQLTFHITKHGISYQQYRLDSYSESEDPQTKVKRKDIIQQTIYRTDIKWINANTDPVVTTDDALPGYDNYYLDQCPNGAVNVKSYKGITFQNIYNRIDLHYYEKEGHLKYDYIVAPHADYKQIQLKVDGALLKLQHDGSLLIETPLGKIQEQAPKVYQNGKQLQAHYVIKNNHVGFEVENYNNNYELIIDPVTRLWGTYYGGVGEEDTRSCTTDLNGNVFLAGQTASSLGTMIATLGSHQSSYGGGPYDGFLAKFSASGVRLWGTYYGGSIANDFCYGACTDNSGNVFVTGYAASSNSSVIATPGSYQSVHGGGTYDGFLVKFNSNGIRSWGTYYGGVGTENPHSCAVDVFGDVYIAGSVFNSSGSVLTTPGCHQSNFGGGYMDAFLAKFSTNGMLVWGTYYGGPGDDLGDCCATDASGNVYLAGCSSNSTGTIIATAGSHQSLSGGGDDSYLVKFDGNGVRIWGTYYGGIASEYYSFCATDPFGNIYLMGITATTSGSAIATTGSHQNTSGGGNWDTYLTKFNNNGVRQWGTFYGGTGNDHGHFCATDPSGNVYIAGFTNSSNGSAIATPGGHQSIFGGGVNNGFLTKFNNNGTRAWGTYYGGATADDRIYGCDIDSNGFIYVCGTAGTNNGTAIATAGSHQSTNSGGPSDGFLVKFADCTFLGQPSTITGPTSICSTATQVYSVTNDPSAATYSWSLPGGWSGASVGHTISATAGSTGIFSVVAINNCGTSQQVTLQVTVNPLPSVTVNSGSVCSGKSFTLVPSGANSYTISGGNFVVSPATTNSYSVTGTSSAGCISALAAVATVTVHSAPIIVVNNGSICEGESFMISPSGADTYTVTGSNFLVSPTVTTSYSVVGSNSIGCVSAEHVVTVTVDRCIGIAEYSGQQSVIIYPNPSAGILNIETADDARVRIIDLQGRLMDSFNIKSGVHKATLERLENGIYFVEFTDAHSARVFRLIKQ